MQFIACFNIHAAHLRHHPEKLSLTCDTTSEPAPIATTTMALSISLVKPNVAISGAITDAVVINATVDEPCADFSAAASRKGRKMPMLDWVSASPSIPAISEFCNILPNMPPAPVTNNIVAESFNALPTHPSVESMFLSSFWQQQTKGKTYQ